MIEEQEREVFVELNDILNRARGLRDISKGDFKPTTGMRDLCLHDVEALIDVLKEFSVNLADGEVRGEAAS